MEFSTSFFIGNYQDIHFISLSVFTKTGSYGLTATGERLLADAGKISHGQAVEKARTEYVKYQARTLSEVEKQYLASLKDTENSLKEHKKG